MNLYDHSKKQDNKLYIRDLFFFLLTCIVSISIAELMLFKNQDVINLQDRIFTYAYLIIPLTLVVLTLSYSYRTKRIHTTGMIRSSIRYKLIIAFIFVSILPSIPIVLLSGDLINKAIDGFFSINIKKGLEAGITIAQYHIEKEEDIFLKKLNTVKVYNYSVAKKKNIKFIFNLLQYKKVLKKDEYFAVLKKKKIIFENRALMKSSYKGIEFAKTDEDYIQKAVFEKADTVYHIYKIPLLKNKKKYILIGKIFGRAYAKEQRALLKTNNAYNKATYFRHKVSFASRVGLALTSLLLVMAAVVISLLLARQISEPILRLAFATRSIAQGDLEQEIDFSAKGEMAVLIESFNQMIVSIKKYKDEIKHTQRLKVWREVAQRVAHEIKNPLTPIQLNAERLKRKIDKLDENSNLDELKEFSQNVVGLVLQEVGTIKRLVNEFSQFSRMPNPKKEMANLNDIFKPLITSYQAYSGLKIDIHDDLSFPELKIDKGLFRQVFNNLLKNSIEAMSEAPGKLKAGSIIEINFFSRKLLGINYYHITLEDNGPEVSKSVLEKLFEPYYSTKREGTGVGLAICEKIIMEHGGSISCENSKKFSGLKFEICLNGEKV